MGSILWSTAAAMLVCRIVLLAVLLGVSRDGIAQTYAVRHLGTAEGVGSVSSLAVDGPDIWMATPEGLLRHDGVRVRLERPGRVHQVAVGGEGTLWLWADSSLYRRVRVGEGFERLRVPRDLAASLARGGASTIVFRPLSDGGLALVDERTGLWRTDAAGQRWQILVRSSDGQEVTDATEAEPGVLWILTRSRLGRLRVRGTDPPTGQWLTTVAYGRHVRPHPRGAWVTTDRGLFLYRHDGALTRVLDDRHRCWFTDPDVQPDGTLALTIEAPGAMSVYLIGPDGDILHRLGSDTPGADRPRTLRFEPEGGLWMAGTAGMAYLDDPGDLVTYRLGERGIGGLRVNPETGYLWAATYGGLFRYRADGFEPIVGDPGLRGATSPVFLPDGSASWTAFGGSPFRKVRFRWKEGRISPDPSPRSPAARLPDGRVLWVRTVTESGRSVEYVEVGEGGLRARGELTGWAAGTIASARVWLAIDERLDTIEGARLGSEAPETPVSVRDVIAAFEGLAVHKLEADREGRVWVATQRGLAVLVPLGGDAWRVRGMGASEGLDAETVHDLDVAGGDRLWLATDRGLRGFTLHPDEPWLRPIRVDRLNAALPRPVLFRVQEDGEGALWAVPDGPAWATRWVWDSPSLPSPTLRLSGLVVNGRAVPSGEALRVRGDTSRVSVLVAPTTFRRLAGVRYEYRLMGRDTTWQDLGPVATVQFNYLGPGRYRVEARAVREGQAPGEVLTIPLTIVPPLWRAPWFLGLLFLGLVGALLVGAWRRERAQRVRATLLESTVAERTAALRAEKETTESQARRLAELDAAKGRFFQNVSHELRTPLTLLLGPLRDALDGRFGALDPAAPLIRHLPMMQRSGERLLGLVDELLDLARLDVGRLPLRASRADLAQLARRTVGAFASRAEAEGLVLRCHVPEEPVWVWVDARRLEQVLTNILSNALRHTPAGGEVVAEMTSEATHVALAVRDTGEGIAEADLPSVFERFHQGRGPARGGAGIGLAFVREVVALHDGTVEVESTLGMGSVFTVRLPFGRDHLSGSSLVAPETASRSEEATPATRGPLAAEADGPAEIEAVAADAPVVLVVEDHPDLRRYLADLLASHYRVETAADGERGLERARSLADEGRGPDLILADVMMPRMEGTELCRHVREDARLAHVPVVLLTARADEASRLDGLTGGADDYLVKPFSADELLVRMENLIEVRRRLRERFSGEVVVRPTDVVVEAAEAAWLDEVRALVEAHLGDASYGVDRLADEVGLSPRQLQRRLKAASGLTPGGFLRTMRLERAADLLDAGSLGVADVARSVGYTEPEAFRRAFRQGFGMPPSAWQTRATVTS